MQCQKRPKRVVKKYQWRRQKPQKCRQKLSKINWPLSIYFQKKNLKTNKIWNNKFFLPVPFRVLKDTQIGHFTICFNRFHDDTLLTVIN